MKLHPEHHISTRGTVAFVIALELTGKKVNLMKVVLRAEPKGLLSKVLRATDALRNNSYEGIMLQWINQLMLTAETLHPS